MEFEPVGCVELTILEDAIIILIHQQPDALPFGVLRPDIHIVLFPIHIDITFNLLIIHSLDNKIYHMGHIECKCLRVLAIVQTD